MFNALWTGRKRAPGPSKQKRGETVPLAQLTPGTVARVACIDCPHAARCERLMAYGLVQGQLILLLQTKPAFLIRVEQTELALDHEVARCIQVEPL